MYTGAVHAHSQGKVPAQSGAARALSQGKVSAQPGASRAHSQGKVCAQPRPFIIKYNNKFFYPCESPYWEEAYLNSFLIAEVEEVQSAYGQKYKFI